MSGELNNNVPRAALARAMGVIALEVLGDPNPRLSTKNELRYGTNGSLSVDLVKGVWFDNEANAGGGVLEFLRIKRGFVNGVALEHLRERDLLPDSTPRPQASAKPRIVATYPYTDADGALRFEVVRMGPEKKFRQRRPDGKGGWAWNMDGVDRIPYRLRELLDALQSGDTIYISEGEKATLALAGGLGVAATCLPGGAGKFGLADYAQWFHGAAVVVLSDNDAVGRKHAAEVVAGLRGKARQIRMVELPGLPPKGDAFDWIEAGGTIDQLEKLAREAPEENAEPQAPLPGAETTFGRLRIRSVQDAFNALPRSYLLDGLIAPGEMSVWWGAPKSGKSFLLLRLAYGLSQGKGMWGREAEKAPVLYVAAEGESGVNGRIQAMHGAMSNAPDFHFIAQRVDLFNPLADLTDLIAACRALGAKLLVLDTLARSMPGGDENKAVDMNALIANVDRLREEGKVHVAIVHHGGWNGDHARGSIALIGAADLVVKVAGEQDGPRSATVEYAKDAPSGYALGFDLQSADLPPDAKGKPRSTCLAVETAASTPSTKGKKLTDEEQGWLRDLSDLFTDEREPTENRQPYPDGAFQRTATKTLVRQWLIRRGRFSVSPGVALTETDRTHFRRGLNKLKDKGKLAIEGELIWLL